MVFQWGSGSGLWHVLSTVWARAKSSLSPHRVWLAEVKRAYTSLPSKSGIWQSYTTAPSTCNIPSVFTHSPIIDRTSLRINNTHYGYAFRLMSGKRERVNSRSLSKILISWWTDSPRSQTDVCCTTWTTICGIYVERYRFSTRSLNGSVTMSNWEVCLKIAVPREIEWTNDILI